MAVNWFPFNDGYVGLLPCGIVIHIVETGKVGEARFYKVRFGTAELSIMFEDLEEAKQNGVELARRILTECLMALEK